MFDQQFHDMQELMELGLLKDVSEKFTENIEVSKLNNNRDFVVYAITDITLQMFTNSDNKWKN